jgi:large repetitive protein
MHYSRYDLLTTILHEMGHLAGMISGNPNFDAHVQTRNGSPIFIGDGFTVNLTPDSSHLDSCYYPNDQKLSIAMQAQPLKLI